jgi:hypothetical protein
LVNVPKTIQNQAVEVINSKMLGMGVLDEPNTVQSDPAGDFLLMKVVDLKLRSISRGSEPTTSKVRTIQLPIIANDEKNHAAYKVLQNWVDTVSTMYAKKQKTKGVDPSSIEKLMAEWPTEIDNAIEPILVYQS